MSPSISLAVWDVPMPVTAGGRFAVKVGAKASDGRALGGNVVTISDAGGAVVANGTLGATILPGTEALYWCEITVPAPASLQQADYSVQLDGATATRFSVVATARPEHRLTVSITETASGQPLRGAEIRLGHFHARTDANGRAKLLVCKGDYPLQLWLSSHLPPSPQQTVTIDGDAELALSMTFVTEDHPDARWVR